MVWFLVGAEFCTDFNEREAYFAISSDHRRTDNREVVEEGARMPRDAETRPNAHDEQLTLNSRVEHRSVYLHTLALTHANNYRMYMYKHKTLTDNKNNAHTHTEEIYYLLYSTFTYYTI